MDIGFLLKSFLIGILAASGCGPIFVLTFNRSAVCGFWKGFATALGASLGDSLYFMLGLVGALAVIGESRYFFIGLDLVGGLVLLALGWHTLKKVRQVVCVAVECSYSMLLSIGKAFTLTVLNPLVILFFMAVSIQVLPSNAGRLPYPYLAASVLCVLLGSLLVLSLVALIASYLGSCLSAKRFRIISGITGFGFILFGAYLLFDFFVKVVALL